MFEIGQQVTWTHRSRRGRVVSMTVREGTVVKIHSDGVEVRWGKRTFIMPASRLRLGGERSELTDFVESVFEANRRTA